MPTLSSPFPRILSTLELVVHSGDAPRTYPLPQRGTIVIGRGTNCDVRIDDLSISRQHASVHLGTELTVEDLGSANGTTLVEDRNAESGRDESTYTSTGRSLVPGVAVPFSLTSALRLGNAFIVLEQRVLASVNATVRPVPSAEVSVLDHGWCPVVLRSPGMKHLYELAALAASSDICALILGETGVGKEVLAEFLHRRSNRAHQTFLRLNCAALSESLLENELFGHEKGAFTGAHQAKAGLLESADGGTVFLDEIGELTPTLQVKLLRVLEERAVWRVGSTRTRPIDVRFVTATNRDLRREVNRERFRKDLYFRINGVTLQVPPLRERQEEIEPLARYFLQQACGRLGKRVPSFSPEARAHLLAYTWLGNVRELKNAMERASFLCTEGTILVEHLPDNDALIDEPWGAEPTEVFNCSGSPSGPLSTSGDQSYSAANFLAEGCTLPGYQRRPHPVESSGNGPLPVVSSELMGDLEQQRILNALRAFGGNQTRAAQSLGISRRTLINRLDEFQLPRPRKGR
jgi:two-component system, NtrC family, response regulator AtoC